MQRLREQLVMCVLPVLVLGVALAAWFARLFDPSSAKYASDVALWWLCAFGVATLSVMVLFGLPCLVRRPLAGVVTSFCLLALFPIQDSTYYVALLRLPITIATLGLGGSCLLIYMFALLHAMNQRQPASLLRCRKCGYNLRGNQSGQCPECGTQIHPRQKRVVQNAAAESGTT